MEHLKQYCVKAEQINGKMTYIISPIYLDHILSDVSLLTSLYISFDSDRILQHTIDEAKKCDKIFLAFVRHDNVKIEKYVWQAVNCYKDGACYYHVYIRDSWKCRDCGKIHYGKFIMPIDEHDPIFYSGTDNQYPPIPPVFKRRTCRNCGKELQNHFIEN